MTNPDAVVSSIVGFATDGGRGVVESLEAGACVEVELDEGRRARLDPGDQRAVGLAQVLQGAARQHLLVYLEVDPESRAITRLLLPHVTRITGLGPVRDGGLEVQIAPSQARHVLVSERPDFAILEKILRGAQDAGELVILTEDDAHRIIDVRPFQPGPEVPLPPLPPELPPPAPPPRRGWRGKVLKKLRSWWGGGRVSPSRAQQVLDAMSAHGYDPLTASAPSIPFAYPDDGCWARAHEMCRLMRAMRLSPKKVWIQGRLTPATRNHPHWRVSWSWYVAPTLSVRWLWLFRRTRVIDPALFRVPVSKSVWKRALGDAAAALTDSDASVYYLWGGVEDPSCLQTSQSLAFYRLQLQNRAVRHGPPPYARCLGDQA